MKRLLGIYARGMAMGAADVVPGVSGGTLALITGIYEELIDTLGSLDLKLLRIWRRDGFAAFWQAGNFTFLLTLFAGIVTSIVFFARLITWLMLNYPVPLWAFFCGLILASVWVVLRPVRRFGPGVFAVLAAGFAFAWWIGTLPGLQGVREEGLWQFFLAGALAICAMILPGISGSFILVLLGMYAPVLNAVHTGEVDILLTFMAGCATGLLAFVHLLKWLLHRYHDLMMGLLAGFMVGSVNTLWPWQADIAGSAAKENLLPQHYLEVTGLPPMVIAALVAVLAGVVLVGLLSCLGSRHKGAES